MPAKTKLLVLAALSALLPSCAKKPAPATDAAFQKQTQEALILAKPGMVLSLPAGTFHLDRTLSLTVDGVTIRGQGIDKTVLSFEGQKAGSSGMLVTANNFTLEDLAIEDTAGDALKVTGATNVTIRRVRTAWTHGPKTSNGSYGIYPVQCKNVLVEDSVAIGASDAGIYVGQSQNIVVRRNRAEENVAGIEIENSQHADVYENTATRNTGGILVFNLPDLPVKDGQYARVFSNRIVTNNTDNFGAKGSMVAQVPAGTGLMVMATKHIDVFKNTIEANDTSNILLVSYFSTDNPIHDAAYDPYEGEIYIHDNVIANGGRNPATLKVKALALAVGKPLPDIAYDGVVKPGAADDSKICIQGNGAATFVSFDGGDHYRHISRDLAPHNCSYPALEAVNLPAAAQEPGAAAESAAAGQK
jgi:parallel beta-helix repeat protein